MKKLIVLIILLAGGWFGYNYFSAYMNWVQFQDEVDALLQTPAQLNRNNLPEMLSTKAEALGFDLDPDDVEVRITSTDRETTVSSQVAGKGLQAENRELRLDLEMRREMPWGTRIYTLERERRFTKRLTPAPRENEDIKGAFD